MKQTNSPIKALWDDQTLYLHLNDLWTYLPFKALKNVYPHLATYKAIQKKKWFNAYYATPEALQAFLNQIQTPTYISTKALEDLKHKLFLLEETLRKEHEDVKSH